MTLAKPKSTVLINAVVWAAMMLATSYLLVDVAPEKIKILVLLFIAGWFTVHSSIKRVE